MKILPKYILILLLLLILLSSCRTTDSEKGETNTNDDAIEQVSAMMYDLSPREGHLYFFTIISRQQYRDKEETLCREEAARQVSRYYQINGVSYSRTDESVRGTAKKEATGIAFNDDQAKRLEGELELVNQLQTNAYTAALYSYPQPSPIQIPYAPGRTEETPEWVNGSVRISGFQTAVGFTGPQRFLAKTLQQADKNALATLLEQRTGSLDISQADWQSQRASSSRSSMTETAAGSIRQAYILSRWIDGKGNFYALAVCPLP